MASGATIYLYGHGRDDNDAVLFEDGYSDSEREIIFTVLGERMQPERWKKCQDMYLSPGVPVTFRTYEGIGHGTNQHINTEVVEFFRTSMDDR